MGSGRIRLLLVGALLCLFSRLVSGDPLDKSALIGKWDYTSFTILQNGSVSGVAHFAPGTMVFTYRENGTWEMEATDARRTRLNGTFEVKGNELIMKKADGSPYQDVQVEMSSDWMEMTLKDSHSIVTAHKFPTSP
jgi:hypothetical protein